VDQERIPGKEAEGALRLGASAVEHRLGVAALGDREVPATVPTAKDRGDRPVRDRGDGEGHDEGHEPGSAEDDDRASQAVTHVGGKLRMVVQPRSLSQGSLQDGHAAPLHCGKTRILLHGLPSPQIASKTALAQLCLAAAAGQWPLAGKDCRPSREPRASQARWVAASLVIQSQLRGPASLPPCHRPLGRPALPVYWRVVCWCGAARSGSTDP
jgi:hypothetical protein